MAAGASPVIDAQGDSPAGVNVSSVTLRAVGSVESSMLSLVFEVSI
jgi:hypothetical protein